MQLPPLPPRELDRLAALDALKLLDTLPEQGFDDLVEVAAILCGVPIAAVSFVGQGRQWFKASQGLTVSETPRSASFCAHAILDPDRLFEVHDALDDERFRDNPLVLGQPEIRFYAGVPLVTDDGHALGALCVLDTRPRHLTASQQRALRALSRQVMAQVTTRKRTQDLLELELRQAHQAALEANAGRTRLLATTSHELRTPLNGILGMASLVLATSLDHEQREMVETLRDSSQQMLALLNQLLEFARLEAETTDQVDQRPLDIVATIDEVVDQLAPEAARKGIEFLLHIAPETPVQVRGDASKLRQILVNLLGNAVKFTPTGPIHIEVGAATPSHCQVAITDSGPGIATDQTTDLFKPFYRLERMAYQTTGTGLGLAICRRLVEQMGGGIQAENVPGRGARFSFTFAAPMVSPPPSRPLIGVWAQVSSPSPGLHLALEARLRWWGADVAAGEPSQPPADGEETLLLLDRPGTTPRRSLTVRWPVRQDTPPDRTPGSVSKTGRWLHLLSSIQQRLLPSICPPPGLSLEASGSMASQLPLSILLVEDNIINQRVAIKLLEKLGYQVTVVSDGLQAVETLRLRSFDVVLMDLQMPVLDGLEATRQLRREGSRAWVVALTASAFESDRRACAEVGMNDYLTKPLLLAELIQSLRRASDQRQLQQPA